MIKRINFYFGKRAYKMFGAKVYFSIIRILLFNFFTICRARSFSVVDRKVPQLFPVLKLHLRKKEIQIDIRVLDKIIKGKGEYVFAGIREIFLKNCYLDGFPKELLDKSKNFIDLGANMGMFSLQATIYADKIVSVECQKEFSPIYESLMHQNSFSNYKLFNYFIGSGGLMSNSNEFRSLQALMTEASMEQVDFLKVDIEGSEYQLFEKMFPFDKIQCISMELHPEYGSNEEIERHFLENNFIYTFYNDQLEKSSVVNDATYVKAYKQNLLAN